MTVTENSRVIFLQEELDVTRKENRTGDRRPELGISAQPFPNSHVSLDKSPSETVSISAYKTSEE